MILGVIHFATIVFLHSNPFTTHNVGSKVDAPKWTSFYDGLNGLIFCLAISTYDQESKLKTEAEEFVADQCFSDVITYLHIDFI